MSMLLDKTIRLFLDSIGKREEYEFYLERFKLGGQSAFALIVPEYEGFAESASVFVFDLTFLLRLGLHPVVLLPGEHAAQMAGWLQEEEHPFLFEALTPQQSHADRQAFLQRASESGCIAVLVGENVSMEAGLALLVPQIARRVHVIRAAGPLHAMDGSPLWYYQTQDAPPLLESDRDIAQIAARLLAQTEGLHISIASPLNLLAELFTVKGAGCLVRRGARIACVTDMLSVDRKRLVELLENSFGRCLLRPVNLDDTACLFLDENYRCAGMLEPYRDYMYVSKFAVHREARGEGLAQELWRTIGQSHPSIFWRSRMRNPFNQWYDRQADGYHTEGNWRVYWRGVARHDIPDIIASALAHPVDFAPDTA